MADVIKNYSKFYVCAVVRLLQTEEVSQREIRRRLVSVHGQVFRRTEVSLWYNKFKDGRTSVNDDPEKHRGSPKTSHADGIVEDLIRAHRRVKVLEKHCKKDSYAKLHSFWKGTLP
jgi:hypothetical protein